MTGQPIAVTDGGIEAALLFREGFELPCFASFPLLSSERGREAIGRYFAPFFDLSEEHGPPFLLGTATWRAMLDCACPTHVAAGLHGEAALSRIGGLRANASMLSHAELDEAEELDEGDPEALGRDNAALSALLPGIRVLGGCCGTDHRHVGQI